MSIELVAVAVIGFVCIGEMAIHAIHQQKMLGRLEELDKLIKASSLTEYISNRRRERKEKDTKKPVAADFKSKLRRR